jgi:predicted DNA-binding protein (MmcQ/YjbR family)
MNIEAIRDYCLSKKAVEEALPFGPNILVFKIMGKAFLLCALDASPLQLNVKCEPEKAIALRERYLCVQPGYHMNKKHWNTLIMDGTLSADQVKAWISDSYDLVVSKLPSILQKELSRSF